MASFTKATARLVAGYSLALLVTKFLALVTSYLLALRLSNADFGYISLAQALFLAAISISGFNAQAAFVRYSHDYGPGAVLRALAPVYWAALALAVLVGIAIVAVVGFSSPYAWFGVLPLAGLVASHLASASAVARTRNDLRAYAVGEVSRPATLLLAILLFFFMAPTAAIGAFYGVALLASSAVAAMAGWALQWRVVGERRRTLSTPRVVAYVMPLLVMQLVSLANNVSDRFFLAAWLSIEDVGMYGKAYLAGSTLGMLFDSISILWGPYVVKHRGRYAADLHPWVRRLYAGSWLLAAVLLGLAWLAHVLSDRYTRYVSPDMVTVGLMVMAAFVTRIGYQVSVPILSAFDRTPVVARLALASALFGVVANVCLIRLWGVYGAAFATLVAFAVFSVGAYANLRRIAAGAMDIA